MECLLDFLHEYLPSPRHLLQRNGQFLPEGNPPQNCPREPPYAYGTPRANGYAFGTLRVSEAPPKEAHQSPLSGNKDCSAGFTATQWLLNPSPKLGRGTLKLARRIPILEFGVGGRQLLQRGEPQRQPPALASPSSVLAPQRTAS
ncbi:hypothetical protein SD81_033805 [Tolypothrix campylonemoides VB511288]|nr:hypothetical protein SD81_033805 [Tolypothrix campylonemoides VB511288]